MQHTLILAIVPIQNVASAASSDITSAMGSSYPGRDRGSPIWMTNELADAQLRLRRQLVGKPLRSSRSRQQAAVRPVHCG